MVDTEPANRFVIFEVYARYFSISSLRRFSRCSCKRGQMVNADISSSATASTASEREHVQVCDCEV